MSSHYVCASQAGANKLFAAYLLWDKILMKLCIAVVELSILLRDVPIVGNLLRRATLMSGSFDTNAMLCTFLRLLYTYLPPDLRFDPQEQQFAAIFLEWQYFVFAWCASRVSMRLLPPLLRPLYKSYYGRAIFASNFVQTSILDRDVSQIVILGAGYDTTAYRTRAIRVVKKNEQVQRFVRVFEVDLPRVQHNKLNIMKQQMSQREFDYYTEGVTYVECNFGQDSLLKVLLESGYNPARSTAILWEGVTYYLERAALEGTLSELQQLAALHKEKKSMRRSSSDSTVGVTPDPFDRSPSDASSNTTDCSTSRDNQVWLFMDYMQEQGGTLDGKREDALWALNTKQATALGTSFITGFQDVVSEMAQFGAEVTKHVTYKNIEEKYFTQVPDTMTVLIEANTTQGHTEPHLNLIECTLC